MKDTNTTLKTEEVLRTVSSRTLHRDEPVGEISVKSLCNRVEQQVFMALIYETIYCLELQSEKQMNLGSAYIGIFWGGTLVT
ncbi:MAG: hypothetical protein KME21_27785 [Desmonostoc vinosum HA7617-LM4]|nr:hypothetical protein [Desmonostoc vinosum HA7617-LM4]